MGTYLINFIVYSMAMVGLLFVCLLVYKKTMVNAKCSKNNNDLSIENALSLNARKTLYVINAGNEKFLIASDADRTTFLSKLDSKEKLTTIEVEPVCSFKKELSQQTNPEYQSENSKQEKVSGTDYSEIIKILDSDKGKAPVMKELLRKLDEKIVTRE